MILVLTLLATVWGALFADTTVVGSKSAPPASAVELSDAVDDIDHGALRFSYKTRDGVRGNGRGVEITHTGGSKHRYFNGHWDEDDKMVPGLATVVARVRNGHIGSLEVTVGLHEKAKPGCLDLGQIDSVAAASFLVQRAPRMDDDSAEEAMLGAVIARDAEIAEPLLAIVRNRDNPDAMRENALFWVSTLAADKALNSIQSIIDEPDEDLELREHAVFALAHMDQVDTLPMLIKIARNEQEPQLQRVAFFALAEHDTPEVHRLFEEFLLAD